MGRGHAASMGEGARRALGESARQVLLGTVVPFALFAYLRGNASLTVAILAVTLWSSGVILWTWRARGRFDLLTAGSLVFLLFNAVVGIFTGDAVLYLALPAIEQAVYALILIGSVAARRPLFGVLGEQMSGAPPHVARSESWRRAFAVVTLAWAAGSVLRLSLRLGLLLGAGVDLFLAVYPLLSWALTGALLGFTFWYPQRRLRLQPHAPPTPSLPPVEG